ncbi:MAG TPA: 3' terminal RNA ribose 2'-O-methyltransferase Hen1 [Symbiobacteriaceae bacterium]|nr:3' terminal RNA ribose 2'-O-methyltransferase Hen1 [Symbiobacteriaceae bacterium]
MLLTITYKQAPATDLGYLLHKNPARVQTFPLAFGSAHVFYPEVGPERCTAALLLEIDPVGLVRGKRHGGGEGLLDQYVNDRPYVASSFLSVAVAEVFSSALSGRSKDRPDLAEAALPLEATISMLPSRGGEATLRRLFEPLGYVVGAEGVPLDEHHPDWGSSPYFRVTLRGNVRLRDLLRHIYVLVPVLDHEKHYWVGDAEVEKLLRNGEGWLAQHPERELIAHRYLKFQRSLAREALTRLVGEEGADEEAPVRPERQPGLHDDRIAAVAAALKATGARRVLDLGCGEGKLLRLLMAEAQFEQIVGLDVAYRSLEIARERLNLEQLTQAQRDRITLLHGSLTYRDARLTGFDAAAVVEVIEHLDPARLEAFEQVLFGHARPASILLTTPNAEYNARFERMAPGTLRHADHRFEWTRAQFEGWAQAVAARHGYSVRFEPLGPVDPELGAPTQMGVFAR